MALIITLIILGLCCILNGAPIGVTFMIGGFAFIANSYKLTKSGKVDGRSKTNFVLLSIGIGLCVVGFLLIGISQWDFIQI